MKTHRNLQTLVTSLVLLALAGGVSAQQHYPAGAEGIKTASLPPSGVYLRDYNFFYFADRFPDGPPKFDVFAYINAPRLIWMTDKTILGATYGMDLIVPFGYTDVKVGGAKDNRFGLADIQIEPLLLSWHTKQFDVAAAYALWAPTGDFNPRRMANLGMGFWSHMLTAGATWYPDEQKTWAVGLLNRYEIHHEQQDTHITPGQTFTAEWSLSRTVCKGVDLGLVGYWQQQVTKSTGPGTGDGLSHVVAIGPEVLAFCPKLKLFTSLRYNYELNAKDRPEGHTVTLTLTRPF
jgi:hypothetical protein